MVVGWCLGGGGGAWPDFGPGPSPAFAQHFDNLPDLTALRTGTPTKQVGYSSVALPEIGISPFANPMMGASAFQGSNPAARQRMLDLWQLGGIDPGDALAQVLGFTPGFRFNQRPALSYN